MFLENAQLGGYKLKSMIGKGGVAEVWLADQLALDREVAVKVISSELVSGDDADFIDRFKREAHSVARLDHPGILPVFDYGESKGYLYLVMPYARGGNLRSRVRRNPPTKEEIASIFENITGGIGHAHNHGLVHRDLKPANILLNEEGRAFIADFGIAKTMDNNNNMTQAGIILGSPSYMAPEQFLGQADKRSDIYSMGLILYFLLTGRKLYNGRLPFEIGKRHLEEPIPLPDPQVPAEYEPFLYKVLAKNPDERYQTATEMLQAFKQIARTHSAPVSYNAGAASTPQRPAPGPSHPAPAAPPTPPARPAANPNANDSAASAARWMEEKRGGPAQPDGQDAAWLQEKRGASAPNQPDESLFNSFSELKQPPLPTAPAPPVNRGNSPAPNPGEARWMQEKRGEFQPPPEGTMWREFDPSLNSFGELKPPLANAGNDMAETRWAQEKQGGPVPGAGAGAAPQQRGAGPVNDPNRWMYEKQGGPTPPAPNQNQNGGRPDAAYERYSREKNAAPPAPPTNRQPVVNPGQPPVQNGQAQWMQEKRGGPAAPAPAQGQGLPPGQGQWMQEKTAVPGQPDHAAEWRREKEGFGGPGQPGQPQVTKIRRKPPVLLFAIIGVLAVGILAVGAILLLSGSNKVTTTPTANAASSVTPGSATTTAGTTASLITPATSTGTVTTPAATTAAPTSAATTGLVTPSVGSGTGAVPLSGHAGPINAVSWNLNGQSFLTASDDKTIKIWDAASNKVVKTLDDKAKPITDRVIAAVFSSDGQFVVATLADKTVNVYSVANGNVVTQQKGDQAVPAAIAGDSSLVVFAGSRTIHSFDLKKNAVGPEFPYFDPSVNGLAPTALAFTPDNSTLAVGLNNGRIILYTVASGKPIMEIELPTADKSGVRRLAWYGTGATHLAVGRDGSFDTMTVDLSKKIATDTPVSGALAAPATNLSVSPDSKRLAISAQNGDLQLWSLETNAILTRSTIGPNPVIGLHWSKDSQKITIATGGSSPALNTVDAQQASRSTTVTLTAQNGTKVTGTAVLTEMPGGSVRVVLDMQGLDPGQHKAHIHVGTCANQGDIKFDLETLRTTADGKATSMTVIKADFNDLITGQFYVNVHNDPGTPTYIASCGEIHV